MLYFTLNANNEVTKVSSTYAEASTGAVSRWDFDSFAKAEQIAAGATKVTGELHVAVDSGPYVSPRFDVVRAPAVGDKVSYGFNGDYYPDGVIVSVGSGVQMVVKTSTGQTYRRRRQTGSWRQAGGTWSLVQGHIDERNPSF